MRYIETQEPTYNRFQTVSGSIVGAAAVIVFTVAIVSLISAL